MGWETEVDLFGTSASRVSFAYTVDGNIPIPPNQSHRGFSIATTAIRNKKWSARISNFFMANKGTVVEVSVWSECVNIYSNVEGLSQKKVVTTVGNPFSYKAVSVNDVLFYSRVNPEEGHGLMDMAKQVTLSGSMDEF
ncbi:hypothetical protein LIER_21910 [Lithospermum erythrorhizon]|uniref:Uncharacterized protein n=1 Tax=Lithospermum erythrorhizon TaxID=34254 RepID=A0AAV3QTG6_LITER